MDNQQRSLLKKERSTTIPKGSTGKKFTGKRSVFLNEKNIIYMLLNVKTNMFYIGSAANYANRMSHHIYMLRHNKHKNKYLQNAWNKYSEISFKYYIIEKCNSSKELLDREQYYLDLYKPFDKNIGYNLCRLASRNRFGMSMPESAKKKIGDFWRGKKWSKERLEKHKKRVTENQGKGVLVYNKKGKLLYEFDSRSEASRKLDVDIATISMQCKENRTSRLKYTFRNKDIV